MQVGFFNSRCKLVLPLMVSTIAEGAPFASEYVNSWLACHTSRAPPGVTKLRRPSEMVKPHCNLISLRRRRTCSLKRLPLVTSFMFLWAFGAFVAPALSGGAMELAGPDGMPALAAGLSVLFLALLVREIRRAARVKKQPAAGAAD